MGIRQEKKKVLQQMTNNEDSGLPLDPAPLLKSADLHWFQALAPQPKSDEIVKDDEKQQSDQRDE